MPGSEVKELGAMLREARERKGVTLTDAQQATKIRLLFLQALETQNYRVLPPPFYIRGFIKTYSTYLGLDPRQTVQIFDEMLENDNLSRLSEQYHAQPSADSGGHGATFSTTGLSQGEARIVEASNERLNVTTLNPKPTLPVGYGSADSSGESRALARIEQDYSTALRASDKYVLKPAMLPSTKGTFYMPNFIPAVLVGIIVLAACLLVYRGLTTQPKGNADDATATITAGITGSALQTDPQTTATPTISSAVLTRPPFLATVAAAQTNAASTSKATASAPAANSNPTAQPTAPPTPIQVSPTATAAATVKVEVIISGDTSWLDITVDGDKKVSKLATSGENFSFEGGKISVRAGKPGAVKVLVNGTEREYTKPNAGIITHTWFADGHDVIE
jgi:cytoskeletal protein RodZ